MTETQIAGNFLTLPEMRRQNVAALHAVSGSRKQLS